MHEPLGMQLLVLSAADPAGIASVCFVDLERTSS